MAVLGIDLGARRIGLALSDLDGRLALPAGTLQSRGRARDLAAICALAAERGVSRIVVGLPVHMNGSAGPEARAALDFADALRRELALPVETLDERWTTQQAQRALAEAGPRRRRAPVDALAATILLRTYLARQAAEPK